MLRNRAALAGLVLLSACSQAGADRKILLDDCMKDVADTKACECIVTAKETYMDKDLLRAEVLGLQGKTDEAQAVAAKVTPDKHLENVQATMEHVLPCVMQGES
jgi:hypothetical protein